mgnify:CR=1 FL=1
MTTDVSISVPIGRYSGETTFDLTNVLNAFDSGSGLNEYATFDGIARALRAMAEKASAVAGAMMGRAVRMRGEDIIEELESTVGAYRDRVLGPAAFVAS